MRRFATFAAIGFAALAATVAIAQEEQTPEDVAVEIRQGHMLNYASSA